MTTIDDQGEQNTISITEIRPWMKHLEIHFRVVSIHPEREVFSRKTGRKLRVAEAVVGDCSGAVTLVLWNDDIDTVQVGETYVLTDGYVSVFEECMQLSIGRTGTIRLSDKVIDKVDESNNMSKPFAAHPKRRERPRSKTGKSLSGVQGRDAKGYCTWKGF